MGGGGGELGKEKDGKKQTLGLLGMVAIGFFWVSGGVYANEPLVNSCPPGFVFDRTAAFSLRRQIRIRIGTLWRQGHRVPQLGFQFAG